MNRSAPTTYPWAYGLPVAVYYAALGIFQGYNAKYYQAMGIAADSTQMMLLMVSLPLIALAAQPVWGMVGDRMKWRNSSLAIMIVVSGALVALLPARGGFGWMMALSCLFAAFFTPIQPMMDSIILEDMHRQSAPFGPVRLMGSVGYALTNLLLASLFEGRFHLVPWATLIALAALYASVLVLPKLRGHQRGRVRVPVSTILKLPHMKQLLLLVIALQLAMGYFYSYFTLHFTALPGGTSGNLGLSYFISAVCELPFLLFSHRLYRRFGVGRLMVMSAALMTLRFLMTGLAPDATWLIISQVLHGGGFIVITVAMAMYINDTVPDELKSGGQMLLAVVGYGLARVFGTFGGGFISRWTGGTAGGFLAMAGLCLVAFLLAAPYFLKIGPLDGVKRPQPEPQGDA